MSSENRETLRLGDLCCKVGSGATPRGGANVYVETGTALIRSQNIYDDRFSWSGLAHIDDAAARSLGGAAVAEGDVLINITGDSVARVHPVPPEVLPARVNQHVAILRPKPGGRLLSRYLHYVLCSPAMKQRLLSLAGAGATRKALTKGMLENILVELPSRDEQEQVVGVLGALDDKIAANRRLMTTLLSTAHGTFEQTVDKDRVETTVGEWAEFHNRRRRPLSAAQRLAMPGKVPYYGATGVFDYVSEVLFDEVLVLVGEDGSVIRENGTPVTQYIWGAAWVNNHAHALTGRGCSTEMLMLALQGARVSDWVTGAVQPKLSMGNLRQVPVRMPTEAKLDDLEAVISPLFALLRGLADERDTLGSMRIALLPKLVSGAIRVIEPANDHIAA